MNVLLRIVADSRWSDTTKEAYRRCVARFLSFAGSDPAAWHPSTVERWRDFLLSRGLGGRTVNKHLYGLRYCARRYEALGYGPDFARAAETVRVPAPRRERRALSEYEARCLLGACDRSAEGIRDRALVTVAIRTGLRASSLAGLRWTAIEGRMAEVPVKGGGTHRVALDDASLQALSDWRQVLDEIGGNQGGAVFRAIRRGVTDRPRAGAPLSRQAIYALIVECGKRAGIRRTVHPHLLRHTFVSWALAAGVPPQRVMTMTGHKNLATLSGYVTDIDAESDPVGAYLPGLEGV